MVGFIPFFNVLCNGGIKSNVINGYIFGLIYNLTAFHWIGANSGASITTVISSLILAVLYIAVILVDKIDFPSPNKVIEKKIPNENFKIVK